MAGLDYIIIGSGINGLVAGALLSRAGKKVLIVERSESFGGCLSTEEITLPGFKHDIMAATFVLFITSPAYAELSSDLKKYGLEFCQSANPTAVIRPNGTSLILSTDQSTNFKRISKLNDDDGKQFLKDINEIAKIIKAPFFYMAVGSQANIGGAASAPVVAAAFSPSLAPVGVLLAVLGYAVGTFGAIACAFMMQYLSVS